MTLPRSFTNSCGWTPTTFSDEPDFVDSWPPHGVADTPGAELHPALAGIAFDAQVKKGQFDPGYSGFDGVEYAGRTLEQILRDADVEVVDVVGLVESHCVKHTALDAVKAGFGARVLTDLTIPVSPEQGEAARRELAAAGVDLTPSAAL